MDKELNRFLSDIKARGYDLEYTSYNASNLMMAEGGLIYDVDLDDNNTVLVLNFLLQLDVQPVAQGVFKRIIDDLANEMVNNIELDRTRVVYILYKEDIQRLHHKYSSNKIGIEKLRAAIRRYCDKKEDFAKIIRFVEDE